MKKYFKLKNKFEILNQCASELKVKNEELLKTIKKFKREINEMKKINKLSNG